MIYAVAGICVIQLRRRQKDAERSFRIPGGVVIPALTIAIFTLLFFGAVLQTTPGVSPIAVPALIGGIFAVTIAYVLVLVPRYQAKFAAQRASNRRRRPMPRAQD